MVIARTCAGFRTLETSHPPTYYFPPGDVDMTFLQRVARTTMCEWKGRAIYYDVVVGSKRAALAAWAYPEPTPAFADMRDHIAFYANKMDACFVNEERVTPQPGLFYGGWITLGLQGPSKAYRVATAGSVVLNPWQGIAPDRVARADEQFLAHVGLIDRPRHSCHPLAMSSVTARVDSTSRMPGCCRIRGGAGDFVWFARGGHRIAPLGYRLVYHCPHGAAAP